MKSSPSTRRKLDRELGTSEPKASQPGVQLRVAKGTATRAQTGAATSDTSAAATTKKIRVLLVDDNMIIRIGLASMLSEQRDIDVVGEASDGQMALELVREVRPQVVIMDVNMPRMNGVEATAHICREFPEIRVVAISMHDEQRVGPAMLNAGAAQFLAKDSPPEQLIAAIRGLSA